MYRFAFLWLGLFTAIPAFTQRSWTVSSPDSAVQGRVSLGEKLTYSISFHNRPAVTDSPLGLEFDGRSALNGASMTLADKAERSSDTTWTNRFGNNSSIRDNFKELNLAFDTKDAAIPKLNVVFRAYNDGIAFRYAFPGLEGTKQPGVGSELILKRELTEFHFPNDPTVWAATYDGFSHPYEHEYPKTKLSSIYPTLLIGLPLVVQTDGQTYLGIAEADLTDWAGMYLKTTARNAPPALD